MIDDIDYGPIKVKKKQKCATYKCNSSPAEMQFYMTEWTLNGGCSIACGVIYCEKCIIAHRPDIKIVDS